MPTLYQIAIITLLVSFIILATTKSEIRERVSNFFALRNINLLYELVECDFCLGFWLSLIVSVIFALFSHDFRYIFVAIFSSPLIRFIL